MTLPVYSDHSTLAKAARALLDNIYEFGAVTDGEFVEALEVALSTPEGVSAAPASSPEAGEVERLRGALDRLTKACRVDNPGELLDALDEADAALFPLEGGGLGSSGGKMDAALRATEGQNSAGGKG